MKLTATHPFSGIPKVLLPSTTNTSPGEDKKDRVVLWLAECVKVVHLQSVIRSPDNTTDVLIPGITVFQQKAEETFTGLP